MKMIIALYISMMPVILGGIFNMLFVKIKWLLPLKIPIDRGKCLKDNRRIFGDSKTVLGFAGMILGTVIFAVFWGIFLHKINLESRNLIYHRYPNTFFLNISVGAVFGFAYMLFELPNSFIKRRLDIDARDRGGFPVNIFVFVFDQIDSMIGVMSVLAFFAHFSFNEYLFAVFIGGLTHISVNGFLILFKVRKYW